MTDQILATLDRFDPSNPYGLVRNKLYRVPASAVSYHPLLADARVFWTGEFKSLPAGGGIMARFAFARGPVEGYGTHVYLRPFAVVEG